MTEQAFPAPPPGLLSDSMAPQQPGQDQQPAQQPAVQYPEPPPGLLSTGDQQAAPQEYGPFAPPRTPEQWGQAKAAKEATGWAGYPLAAMAGVESVFGDLPQRLDGVINGVHAALHGGEYGKSYDATVREEKAYADALQAKYPKTTLGGYLLGLIGATYATGAAGMSAMPEALASSTAVGPWAGRLAWQGAIGGAQGAGLGYAQGQGGLGSEDRAQGAIRGAALGAPLGIAGGALGEYLFGPPMSAAARQAMKVSGLTPNVPGKEQAENVIEAMGRHGPVYTTSQFGTLEEAAQPVLGRAAQVLGQQKNAALALAHEAFTPEAQLSADAVGSIAQDVIRGATAGREGVDLDFIPAGSKAQTALDWLNKLQQTALSSPDGKIPLKKIFDLHKAVNSLYEPGDYVVGALNSSLDRWVGNIIDSHMVQGGPQALADWRNYRQLFSQYKYDLSHPSEMLGKYISRSLNDQQVGNWMRNLTSVGAGEQGADFARGLKTLLGENSSDWGTVRDLTIAKLLNLNPADIHPESLNPRVLANKFGKMLSTPVSRVMLTPEEVNSIQQMQQGFLALPTAVPRWAATFERVLKYAVEEGAGAGAGYDEYQRSGSWVQALIKGAATAGLFHATRKLGAPTVPMAIRTAPAGAASLERYMYSVPPPTGQARGGVAKLAVKLAHGYAQQRTKNEGAPR